MKQSLALLFAVTSLAACGQGGVSELEFGKARLCVPSEYAAAVSPFVRSIAPAGVDSGNDVLISIPANDIQAKIKGYTLSHPNQYTSSVSHEIYGVATSPPSTFSLGPETWENALGNRSYAVIQDPETGYWRVFERRFESLGWHIVASRPEGRLPPPGWYIGYCLGTAEEYHCSQRITMDKFSFDYDLDKSNLEVRTKVASLLRNYFSQWERACKA